jgi:DNA-binding MarR family transcriptional regulator
MTDPSSASATAHSVPNLLGALSLVVADRIRDVTAEIAGHGGETAAALITISAEPGVGVTALSRAIGLSQPGTVRLVDRLVSARLVVRDEAEDGRAVALSLTQEGLERVTALQAARMTVLSDLVQRLSPSDRVALDSICRTLLDSLTTDRMRAFAICRLCDWQTCFEARCPVEHKFHLLAQARSSP